MMGDFRIRDGILERYEGPGGSVRIPEGVKQIGRKAFPKDRCITELVLPASLERLGSYDLAGCRGLKRLRLLGRPREMVKQPFLGCDPEELELPEGIGYLDEDLLAGCIHLKRLRLPADLRKIAPGALRGVICPGCLELAPGNTAFVLRDGMLLSRDGSRLYACSSEAEELVIPEGVRIMDDAVDMPKLRRITLPASLEKLPSEMLALMRPAEVRVAEGNTCIVVQDDLLIDRRRGIVLLCLSDRAEVEIPEGIRVIAPMAFENRKQLRSVRLPKGLERIEMYAFDGCRRLQALRLPSSIAILDCCFNECDSLKSLCLSDRAKSVGGWIGSRDMTLVRYTQDELKRPPTRWSLWMARKRYELKRCTSIKILPAVKEIMGLFDRDDEEDRPYRFAAAAVRRHGRLYLGELMVTKKAARITIPKQVVHVEDVDTSYLESVLEIEVSNAHVLRQLLTQEPELRECVLRGSASRIARCGSLLRKEGLFDRKDIELLLRVLSDRRDTEGIAELLEAKQSVRPGDAEETLEL